MNTNIVKYILKATDMTQTEIANKLKARKWKSGDGETKVTQASVSQWSRGEKLPVYREIELLKIAGLYWELEDYIDYDNYEDPGFPPDGDSSIPLPDLLRDKSVDSKWNILVKTELNQNNWYEFITDMLSPKKYKNFESEYNDNDFLKFARQCIFLLNDAGFIVPESPGLIENNNPALFNLFRNWMHRITILQYWCASSLPRNNIRFLDLYRDLPKLALAQCIVKSNYQVPEKTDVIVLKNFIEAVNQLSKTTIDGFYTWQNMELLNFFDDDSFNEILIYANNDLTDNVSYSSSTSPSDEIQKDDDKYLSFSEKKILNGIKNNEKLLKGNEKLLKEILEKINNLSN